MFFMFTKRILIHLLLFVFSEIEMVYFTCDACGEQLKKPSVEKHYTQKCRDCYKLTCIDCLKVCLTRIVYFKLITNTLFNNRTFMVMNTKLIMPVCQRIRDTVKKEERAGIQVKAR